jgi:hypothetical protein
MNDMDIEDMCRKLRKDYGIIMNSDYVFTIKYGAIHLLCESSYLPTIKEVAVTYGVKFDSIHTYIFLPPE